MFDILNITPVFRIAVLQPNKRSTNVSWNVFLIVDNNGLLCAGRQKIFVAS